MKDIFRSLLFYKQISFKIPVKINHTQKAGELQNFAI